MIIPSRPLIERRLTLGVNKEWEIPGPDSGELKDIYGI